MDVLWREQDERDGAFDVKDVRRGEVRGRVHVARLGRHNCESAGANTPRQRTKQLGVGEAEINPNMHSSERRIQRQNTIRTESASQGAVKTPTQTQAEAEPQSSLKRAV